MLLQKFDFALADPSYTLELKQTLTIKPKHFYIHAIPRHSTESRLYATPSAPTFAANAGKFQVTAPQVISESALPLYVLYGSNTGTSERFSQRIAEGAGRYGVWYSRARSTCILMTYIAIGFRPTLGTLDSAAEHIPTDGPVIVVCASFEGAIYYKSVEKAKYLHTHRRACR